MTALAMMTAIAAVEETIELPASVASAYKLNNYKTVRKAYTNGPDKGASLTNLPCYINWYDQEPEVLRMGNFVEHHETVQVDFYAEDSDLGRDYAQAFYDATVAAFLSQQPAGKRFGGAVDMVDLRLDSPGIAPMDWNGRSYPGFRMYLDLVRFETVVPV